MQPLHFFESGGNAHLRRLLPYGRRDGDGDGERRRIGTKKPRNGWQRRRLRCQIEFNIQHQRGPTAWFGLGGRHHQGNGLDVDVGVFSTQRYRQELRGREQHAQADADAPRAAGGASRCRS